MLGGEDQEVVGREVPGADDGLDALVRRQGQQVHDRRAPRRALLHRDLERPQPEDPPPVGEEQEVGVGRRVDHVVDQVLLLELGALDAPAPAGLGPERVGRDGLHVAGAAHGDDDLLVVDQVLDVHVPGVVGDDRAPLVGELLADLPQLAGDHAPQLGRVVQDRLELGDLLQQLGQLLLQVRPAQPGEAGQGHVQDVVGLLLREVERRGAQRLEGGRPVVGAPDGGDDLVEHVDGLEEALDHVGPGPGLRQQELGPPGDHLDLVGHVVGEHLGDVQGAGHPVDQGHRVHAERGLHRGLLEQVVQDDVGVGVTLEPDDQPGLAARRVVLGLGDAVEVARPHQVLDLLRDRGDRRLVGHLGDDDAGRAVATLLDLGHRPQLDRAPPGPHGVQDPLASEDQGAGREVRALDELHQVVRGGLGVLEQVGRGVDHLAQVVGRDVGGHAHGDALGAVDEHVREPGREDRRLLRSGVVVGGEVDRLLVDAAHQLEGERAEPALGVPHGRGTLVRAGAPEVAVPVDQRVAEGEVLDHPGQGLVDGRVTVGVVRAHHVADHLGALGVRPVGQQALVVHRVEDPAVDRLQAVPDVGKGPRDDDRHRVLEEGPLHLLLDLDGLDEPGDDVVGGVGPAPALVVTSRHALSSSASLSGHRCGRRRVVRL